MSKTSNGDDLRQFGRYTIEHALGSGGMATVYAASFRGPGGAVRPIALKLIHPHLAREEGFVRMFVDETRMAMAFQHRNIVQTFDAGEEQGRHFMAMEKVDGYTLRDLITRLRARPFPVDVAIFVCKEIAAALDYAHSFAPELTGQPGAAIHRDVSPSNILLSMAGDVKLADFGVARAAQGERSTSTVVKGKVTYMAPEQARGKARPASDVFSLAAVLYELLKKQPLRHVTSIEDVLKLPAPQSIRAEREDVPASIDALLARALDVDADARPTAREFREALSKELHALQRATESAADAHDVLARLMGELPAPASDPRAQQLARAMLEEARRLETLSDEPDQTAATVPNSRSTPAKPPRDVTPPPTTRRGVLMIVVALGLAGLGAGVAFLLKPAPPTVAAVTADLSRGTVDTAPAVDSAASNIAPTPDIKKTSAQKNAAPPPKVAKKPKRRRPPRRRRPRDARPAEKQAPRGQGTLYLNAVPWAHVTIDGKKQGVTPLEGLKLPAGRHRVTLENAEQGLKRSFSFELRADQVLRRVINLRASR